MKFLAFSSFGSSLAHWAALVSVIAGCSGAGEDGSPTPGAAGSAGGLPASGSSGASGAGGAPLTGGSSAAGGSGSGASLGGASAGSAQGGSGGALGGARATGGGDPGGTGGTSGTGAAGSSGAAGAATGGACTATWDPPATFDSNGKSFPTQASLDAVWDYQTKQDMPAKNQNWIFDQIIANEGTLNYCVRIDLATNPGGESTTISAEQRLQYQKLLETWLNNWVEAHLKGWGCWPYQHVPVSIVGWAVQKASTLSGTVDPEQVVYVNDLDNDGVPRCADACYRGSHRNGDFSKCAGGAAKQHFDLSLWLTYGMGLMGYAYDWGQQVDLDVSKYQHILGHEMGHGFGLPDFYSGGAGDFYTVETSADAKALGGAGFIMQAGSAATVTTFDGWMLRQMWHKFERARHGF